MGYAGNDQSLQSFKAENAFSEAYVVVVIGTNTDEVDLPAATTDQPFGVIQDTASAGDAVSVSLGGITKVVANGAFSKGDLLGIAATTGRVDTVTAMDGTWSGTEVEVIGVALQAATAAGEIVPMLIRPFKYGT